MRTGGAGRAAEQGCGRLEFSDRRWADGDAEWAACPSGEGVSRSLSTYAGYPVAIHKEPTG